MDNLAVAGRVHSENVGASASPMSAVQAEMAKLRSEWDVLHNAGIIEIAVRNASVSEYMSHWEGRAEQAEAEVERLTEAMRGLLRKQGHKEPAMSSGKPLDDGEVVTLLCTMGDIRRARSTLAPLKGPPLPLEQ